MATRNVSFNSLQVLRSLLPWLSSLLFVFMLTMGILFLQKSDYAAEDVLTVRKIDMAVTLPPPPAPPIELQQAQENSPTPSVNLIASSGGANLQYSDKPVLAEYKLNVAEKPEFNIDTLNLQRTISLDFPVVDVKVLDEIPHTISSVNIKYPSALVKKNIKRVSTKVELIIDQRGKAYIKKIVDPVYPEMIDPIRDWVSKIRFTIPLKNGQPIQAIYLYTINFVYRI